MKPPAHFSAGDPSHVQFELAFFRKTGHGITARETAFTHDTYVLPRPEADGRIAAKAHLQHVPAKQIQRRDRRAQARHPGPACVIASPSPAGTHMPENNLASSTSPSVRLAPLQACALRSAHEARSASAGFAGMRNLDPVPEKRIENTLVLQDGERLAFVFDFRHRSNDSEHPHALIRQYQQLA